MVAMTPACLLVTSRPVKFKLNRTSIHWSAGLLVAGLLVHCERSPVTSHWSAGLLVAGLLVHCERGLMAAG